MPDATLQDGSPNVGAMTPTERMEAAAERAVPLVGPAAGEKLKGMFTKEALATFGAVAGLAAVAQFSPIGWVADLAAIGVGAIVVAGAAALGFDIGGGLNELKDYVQLSRAAQSDAELDRAAEHLARAVSTLGIDTIQAILLHKSVKEASPKAAVEKIADTKASLPSEAPAVCIPCQKAAAAKAALEDGVRQNSKLSPDMEQKILYGQRVPNPDFPGGMSNEIIGGHSSRIKTQPNFEHEVIRTKHGIKKNADGTTTVKFIKQLADGKISKIKKSTLAPDHWSDQKIIDTTLKVADTPPLEVRANGETLHGQSVDGVQWQVIKDASGNITSSYPTGGSTPNW